ncbi:MAG: hypothetical protein PHW95_04380 [Patescibacteria group bacterium]|nr:hypothetical protein [Patescibacteria group bacterium]
MIIEVELKIINITDPTSFLTRLGELQAVETQPWRLLSDESFAPIKGLAKAMEVRLTLPPDFCDGEKLIEMLTFCGLTNVELMSGCLTAIRPMEMPKVSVRLRHDGTRQFFTVKDRREKNAEIDRRREIELETTHLAWFKTMLLEIGLFHKSSNEKLRRSFDLGGVHIDFQIGPYGLPFAEIESDNTADVYRVVAELGFGEDQTSTWSDRLYFVHCGGLDPLHSRWISFPRIVDIAGILRSHHV